MKVLNTEYERGDDRGCLTQISTGNWKQVNLIKIKKGKSFGGHYHKNKEEFFYVLEGNIVADFSNKIKQTTLFLKKGDCFLVEPYDKHTFEAIEDSTMIELLSHEYSKEDVYE